MGPAELLLALKVAAKKRNSLMWTMGLLLLDASYLLSAARVALQTVALHVPTQTLHQKH